MMKNRYLIQISLIFIAATILITSSIQAQSCSPGMFIRQGQVDSFKINYPGCTIIIGNLTLTRDVEHLDSLHLITKVRGNLFMNYSKLVNMKGLTALDSTGRVVIQNNEQLKNLDGINKLRWCDDLTISTCYELTDITGISQVSFKGLFIVNCYKLKKIVGFNASKTLTSSLNILENFDVDTLDAFHNIDSIHGRLRINGHNKLKWFSMGEKLKYIRDDLEITNSSVLQNIPDFPLLDDVRTLKLENLYGLQQISSFPVLSQVRGDILIKLNDKLEDINGLNNLKSIGKDLTLYNLPGLAKISGFSKLEQVNRSVSFGNLQKIKHLNSFVGLVQTDSLVVNSCKSLDDISGLTNLDFNTLNYLGLFGNEMLAYCHYFPICSYIQENRGRSDIFANKLGCNSVEELKNQCRTVGLDDDNTINLSIQPNPVNDDFLLIMDAKVPSECRLVIFDIMGRQIHQQIIYFGNNHVDASNLRPGTYLYQVSSGAKILKRGKMGKL